MEYDILLRKELNSIKGKYYVYGLYRPDGRIFYIGKGKNHRVMIHGSASDNCNPIKKSIIGKIRKSGKDISRSILKVFDNEDEANKYELSLISYFGRICDKSGVLSNIINYDCTLRDFSSKNQKDKYIKIAEKKRGQKHTKETRELISKMVRSVGVTEAKINSWEKRTGVPLKPHTDDSKSKIGVGNSKVPLYLEDQGLFFLNQNKLYEYLVEVTPISSKRAMKNLTRQMKLGKKFFGFSVRRATTEEAALFFLFTKLAEIAN